MVSFSKCLSGVLFDLIPQNSSEIRLNKFVFTLKTIERKKTISARVDNSFPCD